MTKDLFHLNQSYSEGEIEKAIDSLSDEFRIPFRMHIEGYKYKEIADELGSENRNGKKQDLLYASEINADVKGLRKIVLGLF